MTGVEFDDGVEEEENLNDPDEIQRGGKKRRGNSGNIILEIDPRKIVEQTTATSDRLGLSSRQTAMMLTAVVKAGGGDLSKVPLSKSAVHVKRKKTRFQKGKEIHDKKSITHFTDSVKKMSFRKNRRLNLFIFK